MNSFTDVHVIIFLISRCVVSFGIFVRCDIVLYRVGHTVLYGGTAQCGVVWCGVVWCGVVCGGALRCVVLCCSLNFLYNSTPNEDKIEKEKNKKISRSGLRNL